MALQYKKGEDGALVLDDKGDPILLDRVVLADKHERIASERDELKSRVDELDARIKELSEASGTAEELKAKVDELTAAQEKVASEYEQRIAERERAYALDTALLGAGLSSERLKAAKALVDTEKLELEGGKLKGLDLEAFKKDNAYLFDAPQVGDTGLPGRGAGGKLTMEEAEKLSVDEYAEAKKAGKLDI